MLNNEFIIEDGVLLKYSGKEKVVVIPNSVEVIGENSFKDSGVEKVIIPGTVCKIMCGAFENCQSLYCVQVTDKLVSIQIGAFSNCPKLNTVDIIK